MGKNVVIHIGLPKALSSFLQTYIFPYLSDTYFEGKHRNQSNPLTNAIQNIISYKDPLNLDIEKERASLSNFIYSLPQRNIVISEEALFGCYFNNYRDKKLIIDLLHELFPDAKILIIIRRQDTLVDSLYKHMLKVGYSVSFQDYINYRDGSLKKYRYREGLNIDVRELNFYSYVTYCRKLFGSERIQVIPFELFLADKKKFLSKLFNTLSLPPYFPEKYQYINRSYSTITAPLARALNRFIWGPYNTLGIIPDRPFVNFLKKHKSKNRFYNMAYKVSNKMRLRNLLSTLDKLYYIKGSYLKSDIQDAILTSHYRSNKSLSKLLNMDLSKWGYHKKRTNTKTMTPSQK